MENTSRRKLPKTGIATVVIVLALLVYSTRLLFTGPEDVSERAAELCRSIIPALHLTQGRVAFTSTEVEDDGTIVRVFYRIDAKGRRDRRRWALCTFDLTVGLFGEPQLEAVETDIGRLGDGRLFVIKRWWLENQNIMDAYDDEFSDRPNLPIRKAAYRSMNRPVGKS